VPVYPDLQSWVYLRRHLNTGVFSISKFHRTSAIYSVKTKDTCGATISNINSQEALKRWQVFHPTYFIPRLVTQPRRVGIGQFVFKTYASSEEEEELLPRQFILRPVRQIKRSIKVVRHGLRTVFPPTEATITASGFYVFCNCHEKTAVVVHKLSYGPATSR